VDPAARIARAQAGCLLGDIDRETQIHGLATCLGYISNTGAAGLTLGGGMGYMSRRFGWTSDNVLSM
jgi:FAD/FMN-containing dehydrogenase